MTLLYLDTSAPFKRYVEGTESEALLGPIETAPAVGTALITRVEVAAALAKAVRDDHMPSSEAREAESDFLDDWADFTRGSTICEATMPRNWRPRSHGARPPKTRRTRSCSPARQRSAPRGCGERPRDVAGMNAADVGAGRLRAVVAAPPGATCPAAWAAQLDACLVDVAVVRRLADLGTWGSG